MYIERDIEKEIVGWLEAPEIIAIRGPRQSGKTTLLKKIAEILAKKHKKVHIHLISLEEDLEREKFESNPEQYIEFYGTEDHFFLLDEVQYVKNAGKILKILFDKYKKIKFIITGSSTLDINQIGAYLVGRILFFELYPFSFPEFLKAKNENLYLHYEKYKINLQKPTFKKSLYLHELNGYLREYLTFGGYPRIVLEHSIENKKFLLKNLFTTYIERDVVRLYGIKNKDRVITSLKYLASILGNLLHYESIGEVSNFHHKETKEVLSILENTYVINIMKPFHKNLVTELKKNPKVYFVDLGLRNVLLDRFEFSEQEFGCLLENYVSNLLREAKFWRTTAKAEVDFIFHDIPIEVKMFPKITRSFRSYVEHYQPRYGFVLTLQSYEKVEVNNTKVYVLPVSIVFL